MRPRNLILPLALCLAAPFATPTTSQEAAEISAAEYGVVLNLSGKQRMLTQKMSKEVLLIALGVEPDANQANLEATAALFDRTLAGLRDGDDELGLPATSEKRILKQLDKIQEIWDEFRPTIDGVIETGRVDSAAIDATATQNLPLLKQMNKCVKLYEKEAIASGLEADPSLAVSINLAGKQRMLSQKMSKEFLLMALGHEVDDNRLNLIETSGLFDTTLLGLLDGDENLELPGTTDEDIRKQLGKVQDLWTGFHEAISFATKSDTTDIPRENVMKVYEGNLPLLSEMNAAVGMFEGLASK